MARGSERETSPQQTGVNAARDGDGHRQRTLRACRRIARRHQDAESIEIKRRRKQGAAASEPARSKTRRGELGPADLNKTAVGTAAHAVARDAAMTLTTLHSTHHLTKFFRTS